MNSEQELLEECVRYFRTRAAYQRALEGMRGKWRSYGRASGRVTIPDAAREEREALGRFLGKDFSEGPVRFSLQQFEAALGETRFAAVSLEELLTGYFGETLSTHREETERKRLRWEDFLGDLYRWAEMSWGAECGACQWLTAVRNEKKWGYHRIRQEYAQSPEAAAVSVHAVCGALSYLEAGRPIRMAVLGAEITRNPHAFDRDTAAGNLLIQALCHRQGEMECRSSEAIRLLYHRAGILPDDLSSFTAVYGVHLLRGKYPHPAYECLIAEGESCLLTLANLERVTGADAAHKKVYIVENQMVFSHLCEILDGRETALICTSGRVKTASWILLDLLSQAGCHLYYSGDFDPEGLNIAETVLRRYPDCASLWHMTVEDYLDSLSREILSSSRLRELDALTHPCFEELKAEMQEQKLAGYQEQLLGKLAEDLRKSACGTKEG
ncbi:MAG: TIGR02679 family protein [Lachnospiraceae bacterium]|nr:TIGR02679 family protein [Lachnospiraceae bacterium]